MRHGIGCCSRCTVVLSCARNTGCAVLTVIATTWSELAAAPLTPALLFCRCSSDTTTTGGVAQPLPPATSSLRAEAEAAAKKKDAALRQPRVLDRVLHFHIFAAVDTVTAENTPTSALLPTVPLSVFSPVKVRERLASESESSKERSSGKSTVSPGETPATVAAASGAALWRCCWWWRRRLLITCWSLAYLCLSA